MAFLLHVDWLFLRKNCSGEKQFCLPLTPRFGEKLASKVRRRRFSRELTGLEVIRMLLTYGFRETAPNNYRAEPVEIWKARKFIEKYSGEQLSLTKVAKAVNISANHLSEKFKQVAGVNFVEYVAHIRFKRGCNLLQNPNLRISEIAFAVGFQSLSQFNRVFKKFSGKSPTQYRAALARAGIMTGAQHQRCAPVNCARDY
jgi:AraC-like DNA-binding protein